MILITGLNDPRIHPDKVNRTRSGPRQEFRIKNKRSLDGDFYIDPPERHFYLEPEGDGWKWVNGCSECNGEPRDWMTYVECEKHNVCQFCGCSPKEAGTCWGSKKGWICQKCVDIRHEQDKIEALAAMPDEFNDWDYHNVHTITCPYCAYQFSDSWEHSNDEDESHECPRCDNTFTVTAIHSLTFDCSRID